MNPELPTKASRTLGQTAVVIALVLSGSSSSIADADEVRGIRPSATTGRPPNILIIVTDDQRAGTMSHMRKTRRWFQKGGIRFPNAYVTTPVCCPSRASIMTGRYAHNHRVQGNGHGDRLDHSTTLQKYLHQAGYTTSFVGKLLNGWDVDRNPPHFDRWAILGLDRPYVRSTFNIDGRLVRANEHSTVFSANQSMTYLRDFEREDGSPWLMYVMPYSPHNPYTPTLKNSRGRLSRYSGNPAVFESNRSDKPPWIRRQHSDPNEVARAALLQRRSLLDVDDLVGRIFVTLKRLGEARNTLAFYLSDNGFMWGEHGLMGKFLPYLPSVQIPMFVRWPSQLAKGRVDTRLAANIDLVPTALAAAGVPLPSSPAPDGRSLFGAPRKKLLLEGFSVGRAPVWASLLTTRYQYIESYSTTGKPKFKEYYRLKSDPWQLKNVFRKGRGLSSIRKRRLTRMLAQARVCNGAQCQEQT